MVFKDQQLFEKIRKVEGNCYNEISWVGHIIYGSGGINRYYWNNTVNGEKRFPDFEENEVVFSVWHSSDTFIEKAKEAGFRMFF